MGFLRFLLIFIVVSYVLSLIFRFIIRRYFRKVQNNFEQQQQNYRSAGKKEGEITIEKKPEKEKKFDSDEGEYIDFEEID
ncbi:MAG: DUF4834 family protein [Bacteroidota bacterium]